jgi:hypothetical protein
VFYYQILIKSLQLQESTTIFNMQRRKKQLFDHPIQIIIYQRTSKLFINLHCKNTKIYANCQISELISLIFLEKQFISL